MTVSCARFVAARGSTVDGLETELDTGLVLVRPGGWVEEEDGRMWREEPRRVAMQKERKRLVSPFTLRV